MQRAILATFTAMLGVTACGNDAGKPPIQVGGARPTEVGVPAGYDADRSYPLILVLHGYGANGFVQSAYLGATAIQNRGEAFVLAPDGLVDSSGRQYWNADAFCCDFEDRNNDDVAYLTDIVDQTMDAYPIDPAAVFIVGHSNGGWMAYRMACERGETFAAIMALAGNTVALPCEPAQPVSILHAHGDADAVVPYSGGMASVTEWKTRNGCGELAPGERLDLDNAVPGVDTQTSSATCSGAAVDHWRIEGGSHIPSLTSAWEPAMWQWLQDHRR